MNVSLTQATTVGLAVGGLRQAHFADQKMFPEDKNHFLLLYKENGRNKTKI